MSTAHQHQFPRTLEINDEEALADPTGAQHIVDDLLTEFSKRWRKVRGDLRETIEVNDAFRLSDQATTASGNVRPLEDILGGGPTQSFRPTDFQLESAADKEAAFEEWIDYVLTNRVLEPTDREGQLEGEHYTAPIILAAYMHGDRRATQALREMGRDVDREEPSSIAQSDWHSETIRQERTETYSDVRHAVEQTRTDLSREFATIVGGGIALREATNRLQERTQKQGVHRTTLTAEVRVSETVNRAAVDRYAKENVEEVGVIPEEIPEDAGEDSGWLESRDQGDDRVCAECLGKTGNTYPVADVRMGRVEIPPYHPRCRCYLVPYNPS